MSGSTPPGCNGSTGTSPAMSTTVACPVDAMYRAAGFDWGTPDGMDLAGRCERWAGLPLLFQPGTEWNYSVATDVLGRVVEVVSGQPLDRFFAERILEPPACLSGGGGLVSTAADYHRFTQLLLRGGELDGVRLLSSRTLRYMTRNHLPGGADLEAFGRPLFAETTFEGVGFGLGFSVVHDPVANQVLSTPGELAWGGAASTAFWVDPAEQVTALFLTQLLPSSTYPLRSQFRQLVYQALVD